MTEDKVVVFVDLLGFASLTEEHSLELERIRLENHPLRNIMTLIEPANPLTEAFTAFHRCLKATIDLAHLEHPLTAITFSDSAFVATAQLYDALNFAVRVMQWLLPRRVPVRIGIAHGSFATIRFRSDVTVESGDHAAHFLGTGVVRSYATERCGIKGLRIILHPSAASLLAAATHAVQAKSQKAIRCISCSEDETTNALGVRFEVDYWSFGRTAETNAWHALQDMWNRSPEAHAHHYEATARAIDRMRIAQGEQPIGNLRRRTILRAINRVATDESAA